MMGALRKVSFFSICLVLIAELALITALFNIFGVKYIVTRGYYSSLLFQQGGKNIFNFNAEELAEKIRQDSPKFKNIIVSKLIPDTIRIDYSYRSPFIIATDRFEKQYYFADSSGAVYEIADGGGKYPVLKTQRISLKSGVLLNSKKEIIALGLIKKITGLAVELNSAAIYQDDIVADIGGTEVVFKAEPDAVDKINALQLLLKRYTIEGSMPQKIDLRFNKPVVKNG